MNELQQVIIDTVTRLQGCKMTQLVCEIPQHILTKYESEDVMATIDQLVAIGEIIEIEYILPQMDYRVKSFLLPKDTKVNL